MILRNNSIRYTLLFASFMFIQLVVLRLANQSGRGYLPEAQQERVYLFIQIAAILGFLAHAMLRSFTGTQRLYKPMTAVMMALLSTGAGIMLFCSPASLFYLIVTGSVVLLLGFVGGAVYERLALSVNDQRYTGLCIGIGYAVAVALQFFLQLQWMIVPILAIFLLISFVSLLILLLRDDHICTAGSSISEKVASARSTLVFSVVITCALLIFTSYYNSYIHHLQIASGYTDYNVYSLPRLLMIPTVILFGFLGDIKGGKFLPVCTLCVAAIALLNTALLGQNTYLLNMCLYYIALTAVIAYYHLTFLRLAERTKHPALWACMGRVLDSVIVILSFGLRISTQSQVVVLIINIAALAAAIIAMALSGVLDLSAPISGKAETEAGADPFPIIQQSYGITPTELKVLRELVQTDDKQEVIASRLNISVSTLRHHITSLYKKTGVQTRLALSNLVNAKK